MINKNKYTNQRSFFFEDSSNKAKFKIKDKKLQIIEDRVYLLFFIFFCLIFIFSIKIFFTSMSPLNYQNNSIYFNSKFEKLRNDIVDSNGIPIARNIEVFHAAIKPNLIKDKKNFLLKLRILYPEIKIKNLKSNLERNKYFYFKKNINEEEKLKLWSLGEKGLLFEKTQIRVYPHKNLFSHVIGQVDEDHNGISGIEKSYNDQLKFEKKPLMTTLDSNLQFLIREELINFQKIFKSIGSASILMDVNNGNILSLVSLPDFDINKRQTLDNLDFINRATKGVYEFGSVFKTFTLASGLNEGVIEINSKFNNLPKKITCAGKSIAEYDDKIPANLTAEEILIRSGNIGSVRIAQKIGEEKIKNFFERIGVLKKIKFDIEEVGQPLPIQWGKCKLATASFGHGITTTLLQLAKGYSIISNGGYNIEPRLIEALDTGEDKKIKILKNGISNKMNTILRKVVQEKDGTANLANIDGYEVGGKTGTAQKISSGVYSKDKINTFVAVFPISRPKYILLVLLDEPKPNKDYIYHYKDGSGWKLKGTPYNTAGWTSVEVAGKIIEKIGPILAINKIDFYGNHVVKKTN